MSNADRDAGLQLAGRHVSHRRDMLDALPTSRSAVGRRSRPGHGVASTSTTSSPPPPTRPHLNRPGCTYHYRRRPCGRVNAQGSAGTDQPAGKRVRARPRAPVDVTCRATVTTRDSCARPRPRHPRRHSAAHTPSSSASAVSAARPGSACGSCSRSSTRWAAGWTSRARRRRLWTRPSAPTE